MAEKARDIRRRIKTVESTKKITNAMQLIAASRIAKAQARTERARPFARAIGEMIEMLAGEAKSSPLLAERDPVTNVGLIVLTGDRGLAGAYNSNVLKEAQRVADRQRQIGRNARVTSVGRKGANFFKFRQVPLEANFTGMSDKPTYADAKRIAKDVIDNYVSGSLDMVMMAYTEFLSAGVQRARVAQILPVPRSEGSEDSKPDEPSAVFEFEPEPDQLLDALLPRYVETKIYGALLESSTSEHAARMRAMKSATDKAEDLIKSYQLRANKARQSEITNEIADIVGATEALSGANK
ncbi:MAG TPA: F0F1 ATP synthase subunit gamma [Actinomycetota bacterium]|nr:F0F1 ATP synthase subunit gamma [Actinomycetota bacterium]